MIYTDGTHLVADTLPELHKFAKEIGLNRCYFEGVKKGHPHYDLKNWKKQMLWDGPRKQTFLKTAIQYGAQEVINRIAFEKSRQMLINKEQIKLAL
jgi:hypothetical protein